MDTEASDTEVPLSDTESIFRARPSEASRLKETEQRGSSPSLSGSDVTTQSITSAISGETRRHRRKRTGPKRKRKADPSFYDLVAGTVRKTVESSGLYRGQLYTRPLSVAEYYFERKRPKTGDEEEDARLYWHREVDHHKLPPSDVLWAVHRYASHFFGDEGEAFLKFMDETALLAMGVLLEETMKESLGKTGYLAFLEPEEEEEDSEEERSPVEDAFAGDDLMDRIFRATLAEQHQRLGPAAFKKPKYNAEEDDDVEEGFTRDDFLTDEETDQVEE